MADANNTNNNTTISIQNAAWWMNHSHVEIKEDMLAEDQAWIANQSTRVINAGTSEARVEAELGSANILLIQRMVVSGLVAVARPNGRVKTVTLPTDAGQLLTPDLDYIVAQINAANAIMTPEQQQAFLTDAAAPSAAS